MDSTITQTKNSMNLSNCDASVLSFWGNHGAVNIAAVHCTGTAKKGIGLVLNWSVRRQTCGDRDVWVARAVSPFVTNRREADVMCSDLAKLLAFIGLAKAMGAPAMAGCMSKLLALGRSAEEEEEEGPGLNLDSGTCDVMMEIQMWLRIQRIGRMSQDAVCT